MLDSSMKILDWLERSRRVPEEAEDPIQCAKEDLEEFLVLYEDLAEAMFCKEYVDPRELAEDLVDMWSTSQRLKDVLQDIEDGLRKTLIHTLPAALKEH